MDTSNMTEGQRRMWDQLVTILLYGLEKGLWDMLGEASFAVTNTVGREMLRVMQEAGLQLDQEDPGELVAEIGRRFVADMAIAESFDIEKENSTVALRVHKCLLMDVEKKLLDQGIKPFMCPFLNIAMAALRERTGGATTITQFDVNPETHRCLLRFQLLD
ncbi:MAG: hypothetical protein GXO54_03220 [Chloroflexi bacterium]|nr:hypothetical protein [Chloroflexota bacterium]